MPFSSDAYSPAQKTLHWLIAALVVVLVPVGLSMANLMEDGPIKNGAYELHKSFGLTVFGLALLRVAVRLVRGAPPLCRASRPGNGRPRAGPITPSTSSSSWCR